MGYYTDYEMVPNKYNPEGLSEDQYLTIDSFIETTKSEGWSYLHDVWRGEGAGFTWYNHDADMGRLSTTFPDVLFTLWGRGEEADDQWKEYYLNGECQVARGKITYPKCTLKSDSLCPSCCGAGVLDADGYPTIGCPKCWGTGEID